MFYENRLGIKKSVISFVYSFCPNTGTKFREPYHSNHVIPHRDDLPVVLTFTVNRVIVVTEYVHTFLTNLKENVFPKVKTKNIYGGIFLPRDS